ncbi:uncharacterized protein TNCV_610401 [Trichonephila clavipes]|nr:uncharacterized protein TNCV_610401 [Trichonephila clavipes]
MAPHTITPAARAIESGFVAKDDLDLRGTTPNGGVDGWASRAVQCAAILNVLQPGAFVWLENTGPLVKVLPVLGWRLMKQLEVRVHFWRCGGLLNDCRGRSDPGLRVNDIPRIYWSQHLLTTQSERPN